MPSGSIHVKVSGTLHDHIQRQIGDEGLYENASEYIRALIRRDLHTRDEAWEALQKELAPAMRADDGRTGRTGRRRQQNPCRPSASLMSFLNSV